MTEKFIGQETGAAIEVKEGMIQVDLWPLPNTRLDQT